MAFIGINQVDDFLESVHHEYMEPPKWQDISMNLQEYYFASRLFDKNVENEEGSGDLCEWKLQIDFNDTFEYIGLYSDFDTSRKDLLTHARMGWSINRTNYTYDILENTFRGTDTEIVRYIDVLEHSMYNSYFSGMEKAMFGVGPTSPTQQLPPPCSLPWWLQTYSTSSSAAWGAPNGNSGGNTTGYTLASGQTSGFLGMDPAGFSTVGAGSVLSTTFSNWRPRTGLYTVFSEDDAIDTIVECIDKCKFKPAHNYNQLVPTERPKYELLTTYSRMKTARRIMQSSNDNLGSSLDAYKGDSNVPTIRGVPLVPVWAWSNQEFGLARTDGIVMGVNWRCFKYKPQRGMKMVKRPTTADPLKPNVRRRIMEDSGQLVCLDRRSAGFTVNSTVTVTEQD